jgi:Mrp family chromosome partitioning ATPase
VLDGSVSPDDAVAKTSYPTRCLLAAGRSVSSPSDLLDNDRLTRVLQGVTQLFDLVVLDCPPVMPVADAAIIAHSASLVLFVVGSGTTSRAAAQTAIDRLTSVQAEVVGVVLNMARPDAASAYHYQPTLTEQAG